MNETESDKTPQWLREMAKANAPFSAENCPTLRLLNGLKMVPEEANALALNVRYIARAMALIDSAPDHESVLDDLLLAEIYTNLGFYQVWPVQQCLANSLKSIEEANKRMKNVSGQLRVKYQGRLHRLRTEARQLMELFHQAPKYPVQQPFAIRRDAAAFINHAYEDLLVPIISLRRSLKNLILPPLLGENLYLVEAELFCLCAIAERWGDNPGQKLSGQMADCENRTAAIAVSLKRLQQNAQYECQNLGMIFANRQGIYRVESC